MKLIKNDYCTFCDVDETLVLWNTMHLTDKEKQETILVPDPYCPEELIILLPHKRNIDLIKRKHGQGQMIIVWSAGGSEWAKTVVKALRLDKIVSFIMCKPNAYIDDLDVSEWGMNRVYLNKDFPPHKKEEIEERK